MQSMLSSVLASGTLTGLSKATISVPGNRLRKARKTGVVATKSPILAVWMTRMRFAGPDRRNAARNHSSGATKQVSNR